MSDPAVEINGWTIYAHPLFLDQLEKLITQVEKARRRDPTAYKKKRATKLLAAVLKVAFEIIPDDPTRDVHRQGNTLGAKHKHWFRAKFLQQFRLFFRYHQSGTTRIIILAWVNDDNSLCAYDSNTDAYVTFSKMLVRGKPPNDWAALLADSADDRAVKRLARMRTLKR